MRHLEHGQFLPQGHDLNKLRRGPHQILKFSDKKKKSCLQSFFRSSDLHNYAMDPNGLNTLDRGSPKDHAVFRRKMFTHRWTTNMAVTFKLPINAMCSGKLKTNKWH